MPYQPSPRVDAQTPRQIRSRREDPIANPIIVPGAERRGSSPERREGDNGTSAALPPPVWILIGDVSAAQLATRMTVFSPDGLRVTWAQNENRIDPTAPGDLRIIYCGADDATALRALLLASGGGPLADHVSCIAVWTDELSLDRVTDLLIAGCDVSLSPRNLGEAWFLLNRADLLAKMRRRNTDKVRNLAQRARYAERGATLDGLTGLFLHAYFMKRVVDECRQLRPTDSYGVAFVDVDFLKRINDSLGHDGGNEAIKTAAACLKSVTSQGSFAGRLGGDEFGVFFCPTDASRLKDKAKQLYDLVPKELQSVPYSLSSGFVRAPATVPPVVALRAADDELYKVKETGRGRFSLRML